MSDEKPNGSQTSLSSSIDGLHKIISILALLGFGLMAWQRTTSDGEHTKGDMEKLQQKVDGLSGQIVEMKVSMSAMKQQIEIYLQTLQQEQRFRSETRK